jgi:hypothetical protein
MNALTKIFGLLPLLLAMGIHAIQSVKPVPANRADLSRGVPILQKAVQPMYPPIAKLAHITGKVIVRVTVRDGLVAKADILSKLDPSGERFLETPTVANLKTWRFAADVSTTFTVTYTYQISGKPTDEPTNDRVEILPSLDVNITTRPVKPTVNYEKQSSP